jgi:hypothetical protein
MSRDLFPLGPLGLPLASGLAVDLTFIWKFQGRYGRFSVKLFLQEKKEEKKIL